jgi:hypothetical protein
LLPPLLLLPLPPLLPVRALLLDFALLRNMPVCCCALGSPVAAADVRCCAAAAWLLLLLLLLLFVARLPLPLPLLLLLAPSLLFTSLLLPCPGREGTMLLLCCQPAGKGG